MQASKWQAKRWRKLVLPVAIALIAIVVPGSAMGGSQGNLSIKAKEPKFSTAVAFDVSAPLSELVKRSHPASSVRSSGLGESIETSDASGAAADAVSPWAPDWLAASGGDRIGSANKASIAGTIANFEGLRNEDNFNIFGLRVNPPDPNGEVGPNHYVEMVNLAFAVYSKTGTLLLGPVDTGSLWAGFPITDCTDPSGDPIVVYDQLVDRWLLTQFTTAGGTTDPYYNCVAISKTGDPTGAYYRYAFITQPDTVDGGYFFPDYPKYGVWRDSYVLTTRDFGNGDPVAQYGISVYGLEKNKMVDGNPKARAVQFFLDSNVVPLNLIGDGLLPADIDGKQKPKNADKIPIVGTQDDNYGYGAPSDALNIWELDVKWKSTPAASLVLKTQLATAPFDSDFPCAPTSRDCLPQPGITDPAQYLDILSYRQRPTWRLAYRSSKNYESMVTNQSVEALPGVAGVRWYEIRRNDAGNYSIHQQGTIAPGDGVHRWMGSAAQDKYGNIAVGYSVVNGTTVYPGIRYTGRLAGDPLGTMPQGEGVVINGSGVQTTTNSRWGDYTSMTVDPVDDCTFWYVNEYYAVSGTPADTRPWQTRIASFKLPGC